MNVCQLLVIIFCRASVLSIHHYSCDVRVNYSKFSTSKRGSREEEEKKKQILMFIFFFTFSLKSLKFLLSCVLLFYQLCILRQLSLYFSISLSRILLLDQPFIKENRIIISLINSQYLCFSIVNWHTYMLWYYIIV